MPQRRWAVLTFALLSAAVLLLILPILMFFPILSETPGEGTGCGARTGGIVLAGSTSAGLSERQLQNASAIASEGFRLDMPRYALVIALAVAHQESGFLNYANDGQG